MTFVGCIVRKTDKTGITATFKANNSIKVRHFISIAPKSYIMYYMKANSIEFLGKKEMKNLFINETAPHIIIILVVVKSVLILLCNNLLHCVSHLQSVELRLRFTAEANHYCSVSSFAIGRAFSSGFDWKYHCHILSVILIIK